MPARRLRICYLQQMMNLSQRQEQAAISGRKVLNVFACSVKQGRTLSPQPVEQHGREQTFQTDSFKQILTKRSAYPNKQNLGSVNKVLKPIKEEPCNHKKQPQRTHKLLANPRKQEKKSSTVSLTKLFHRERPSQDRKKNKSASPSRQIKDYKSGPTDKRNYLSNNPSKTSREVIGCKSEKNLTERVRNPLKVVMDFNKKEQKKQALKKKELAQSKNTKSIISIGKVEKKKTIDLHKTQLLAKEFNQMIKGTDSKKKVKKTKKKTDKTTEKDKSKKSKEKKVVVSHNNSKNFIPKQKLNSQISDQIDYSSAKHLLSTRYDISKKHSKRQRLSFEPNIKKAKNKNKAKTQALSPEKDLDNKQSEAAKTIQRFARGFLVRKNIKQFKRINQAVILIQKMWRGFIARKRLRLRLSKLNRHKINYQAQNLSNLSSSQRTNNGPREVQLSNLLIQILNQKNVNQNIKQKITDFLKKDAKSSPRSSIKSHQEQEMKSEKRYLEQVQKKRQKLGSPGQNFSPRLQRVHLIHSPEIVVENLLTIKQLQKQKIISYARLQIEGVESLTIKQIFSPKTSESKKFFINKKLEEDLSKFQENITSVIKTCKQTQDIPAISPFMGESLDKSPYLLGPEPSELEEPSDNKSEIDNLNISDHMDQDMSMELVSYEDQQTKQRHLKIYQPLDNSYRFIEEYLLTLYEHMRSLGEQYYQQFLQVMRSTRNLPSCQVLKNLNILTEDSDDDISFKLPMYKYLQHEEPEVISRQTAQAFNSSYYRLQRHQLGIRNNLEEAYLKMICDAMNEALNEQRPEHYMFLHARLTGSLRQQPDNDSDSQFSLYFANAMNKMYIWSHLCCGKFGQQAEDEESIRSLNQLSMNKLLAMAVSKPHNCLNELLECIVEVSNEVFLQVLAEETIMLCLAG